MLSVLDKTVTKLLKGNQNNLTSLIRSVIYLIIFCLVGSVFCSGIEGLKQKYGTKKKPNWDKQQAPDIRSEVFRMCSIKIRDTGCIIFLYLAAKLRVKEVSFGVPTWQTSLIIIFFKYCFPVVLLGK